MALTYFGSCDSSGTPTYSSSDNTGGTAWVRNKTVNWTCPGSGNMTLKELSCMCHIEGGSPNLRLAVYSSDGSTKIAEGTGQVAVSGSSDAWQGHLTQASITPNPVDLTGGTNYVIVVGFDGDAGTTHAENSGESQTGSYAFDDYTGGFPSSIGAGINGIVWAVRAGVEASAGASAVPVFMYHYMNH